MFEKIMAIFQKWLNGIIKYISNMDSGADRNIFKRMIGIAKKICNNIKLYAAEHPQKYIAICMGAMVIYLGGMICRFANGKGLSINPIKNLFSALFSIDGWKAMLLVGVGFVLLYLLYLSYGKQFHGERDERGFTYSKNATYGNDRFVKMEQLKEAESKGILKLNSTLEEVDGYLLGKVDGVYLSLPRKSTINHNIAICGSQGSYKSVFFSAFSLIEACEMGVSVIVADVKGEHYRNHSKMFEEAGYTVRVFNTKDFRHSDGWNLLGSLQGSEEIIMLANTLIRTAKGGERWDSFWDGGELNMLQAVLQYVYYNNPPEKRTLTDAYLLLTEKSEAEMQAMFNMIRTMYPNHPANVPWNSVRENEKSLPGFKTGLLNKLTWYQNEYLQEAMRHDEIDLSLPAKEKCAYFVISSDTHSTYDAITSLFFDICMQRIIEYADSRPSQKCATPVVFLMEEFLNMTEIRDLKKRLGTARSRDIGMFLLYQNIPMFQNRYPNQVWEELIGGCDCRLFLGCNEISTANYFSEYTGICTVEVESIRKGMYALQMTELKNEYAQSEGDGKRALMNPTEILNLDNRYGLLFIRGVGCVKIEKVPYFNEPVAKTLKMQHISDYTPKWMENYQPKDISYGSFIYENSKAYAYSPYAKAGFDPTPYKEIEKLEKKAATKAVAKEKRKVSTQPAETPAVSSASVCGEGQTVMEPEISKVPTEQVMIGGEEMVTIPKAPPKEEIPVKENSRIRQAKSLKEMLEEKNRNR